jgi:hypothetical protein
MKVSILSDMVVSTKLGKLVLGGKVRLDTNRRMNMRLLDDILQCHRSSHKVEKSVGHSLSLLLGFNLVK